MKKLKAIWLAISLPFVLLVCLVLTRIKGTTKSEEEQKYLLRQTGIAWFAMAFYADVFLAAFWLSDTALSFLNEAVSYVLSIGDLPPWSIEHQGFVTVFAALVATLHVFKLTYRSFIISMPEFAGALTVNYFGGRFAKYGQGLHLKWPQERFNPKLAFSLERVTVNFLEDYTAKDKGVVLATGSFRYAPSFERLEAYAQVDERSLGQALLNIAMSDLTVQISSRTTDEAREQTDAIKKSVEAKYAGISPIEEKLGFDFEDFTLADIAFDDETKKAMTASFAAKTMFAGLENNPQAREDVLALAGDKIKKTVTQHRLDGEIRGLENLGPALAAFLTTWNAKPATAKP